MQTSTTRDGGGRGGSALARQRRGPQPPPGAEAPGSSENRGDVSMSARAAIATGSRPEQRTVIFSRFWRLEAQRQGAGGLGPGEGSLPVLQTDALWLCVPLCFPERGLPRSPSSYQDANPITRTLPHDLVWEGSPLKGLALLQTPSQCGFGLQHMTFEVWGRGANIQSLTERNLFRREREVAVYTLSLHLKTGV